MSKKYTKEFLESEFWRFYKEYGKYPRGKDMKGSLGFPSEDAYKSKWGSFNTFLLDIGIMGDSGWYKSDEQILLDLYENGNKDEIIDKLMIKRKWNAIIIKANSMGLFRSKEIKYKDKTFSKEFLLNELKRYYNTYNRTPLSVEFEKDNNYPSVTVYSKYFGSWNKALIEAGLEVNINTDYTKENIINNVKEFYKENNRSPFNYEIKYSISSIYKYWNTFNDLLLECGLDINRKIHNLRTKEDGIKFLQDLSKTLNKIPTTIDINNNTVANKDWFTDKFGSFKNALYESGLIHKNLIIPSKERTELSIKGLIDLYNELGRCPKVEEYDKYAKIHFLFSRRVLENQIELKYNDICMKYLKEANQYHKTKEQLLFELEQLKNKLGRTPLSIELKPENNISSLSQYMDTFNMTYNQLIKSLGWELSGHEFTLKNDIELLNDFYFLYLELGRVPTTYEIDADKTIASYPCYKDRIGSIEQICKRLNIKYNKVFRSGTICYDKLGRLCKSLPEKDISNYMIDNNIKHHKEYHYADILNNEKDNRRCDWILFINNKIYYVEYFGIWRNSHSKLVNDYKKKAKRKIKDLYKAGLIEQCIFIFPKDLKKKNLDDIFEFDKYYNKKIS